MNKKNEIYTRESCRKNSEIEKISENFLLKTDALTTIKKYLKVILIFSVLFIIFMIISKIPLTPVFLIILLFVVAIIFFNSYKIIGKQGKITIIQDMQEIILSYSQIKNIYIERYSTRIFFKRIYSYNIILIYETIRGKISDITLPTLFLNPEQIDNFLNNFTVKKTKKDYIQMAKKSKVKRKLIKALLFVIFLILIIVTCLVQK